MVKVKIAIIGLGRVSKSHIDAINHWPDICELAAVVDAQEEIAKQFSEYYGVPYFTSVEGLIKEGDIDASVICLPHHLHAETTTMLSEAGVHILVEKVMATSVEEGKRMVDSAKENQVNLMVGQSRRFFKGSIDAKKRSRELGEISHVLYTLACYFDKESTPKWWRSKEATGGLVYPMQGSHSIDFTLWMMEGKTPVSVYATGTSTSTEFEGDDEVSINIRFDDGTQATNFLSINTNPLVHDCLVIGDKGSLLFKQGVGNTDLVGVEGTELTVNGEVIQSGISKPHNFALQMKEFVDSIIENRQPIASGEEILTQLKIISAAQISAQENKVIKI